MGTVVFVVRYFGQEMLYNRRFELALETANEAVEKLSNTHRSHSRLPLRQLSSSPATVKKQLQPPRTSTPSTYSVRGATTPSTRGRYMNAARSYMHKHAPQHPLPPSTSGPGSGWDADTDSEWMERSDSCSSLENAGKPNDGHVLVTSGHRLVTST